MLRPVRLRLTSAVLGIVLFLTTAASAEDVTDRPEDIQVPEEVPSVDVPAPGEGKRTVIPIPEIIVSPTEGITGGVLGVLLFASADKSINSIFAPDVRYNKITGVWPTLRYFGYPDPLQKYSIVAGKATKHGDFFDADYFGKGRLGGLVDLRLNLRRDEDPFERFYGFGNETPDGNETNYTGTVHRIIAYAGYNFLEWLRGSFQFRFRHVRVGSGEVNDVENLRKSQFNDVEGINGATIVGTLASVGRYARSRNIPTEGYFADFAVEVINKALGASVR
jgi:hypothetical protein